MIYHGGMTPEKDEALCKKYPKIFRDRNGSPQETCMNWGFSCGDGWYDIIDTLCYQIQQHVDNNFGQQPYLVKQGSLKEEDVKPAEHFQVVAAQVKEKFGGLRFYVTGGDPEVYGMIRMAEAMSYRTCETCGNKGKTEGPGWIRTLCDPCRDALKTRKL
jgi:hypothetical protein